MIPINLSNLLNKISSFTFSQEDERRSPDTSLIFYRLAICFAILLPSALAIRYGIAHLRSRVSKRRENSQQEQRVQDTSKRALDDSTNGKKQEDASPQPEHASETKPDPQPPEIQKIPEEENPGEKEETTKTLKEISCPKGTRYIHTKQVPAPFNVRTLAKTSLEEIDNLEYRVQIDETEIERRLQKEFNAAIAQEKVQLTNCSFSAQATRIDQKTADTSTSGKSTSEIRFNKTEISFSTEEQTGLAEARGARSTMEDAHIASSFTFQAGGQPKEVKITGVFDGHGGDECAKFVAENIKDHLRARLEEQNATGLRDLGIWNAIKLAFVDLSRSYHQNIDVYNADAGTTANVALIIDGDLWIANLGDARAILLHPDGTSTQLSEDAKPGDLKYKKSIEKRGGRVNEHGYPRLNGILAVARSFGDHKLRGTVSARPKITKISHPERDGGEETSWKGYHLIQCCDGVFDVASSKQVGSLVHADLQKECSLAIAAKNIVDAAYQAGSTDNLSALVVPLG